MLLSYYINIAMYYIQVRTSLLSYYTFSWTNSTYIKLRIMLVSYDTYISHGLDQDEDKTLVLSQNLIGNVKGRLHKIFHPYVFH